MLIPMPFVYCIFGGTNVASSIARSCTALSSINDLVDEKEKSNGNSDCTNIDASAQDEPAGKSQTKAHRDEKMGLKTSAFVY